MDVDQYLKRLKYNGPKDNKASTLREICLCHARNVPFEILDMFGGPRKRLDLEKVYRDIVVNNRGGFCYEINGLMRWLLLQFGFEVVIFQSQAYVVGTKSLYPEFDHMTMLVTCADGSRWLADVGWGGSSFKEPLKFEVMLEQSQPNGTYRLVQLSADEYVVEKRGKCHIKFTPDGDKVRDEKNYRRWVSLYKFDTIPRQWSDFDEMCSYQQDSDKSFLKYNTLICRETETGDLTWWGWRLRERRYIDPDAEETVMIRTASNQKELREMMKEYFGIEIDFHVNVQLRDFKNFQ